MQHACKQHFAGSQQESAVAAAGSIVDATSETVTLHALPPFEQCMGCVGGRHDLCWLCCLAGCSNAT